MQKITPFFWFVDKAEEAVNFYVGLFNNSKINNVTHYVEAAKEITGREPGSVMTISFQLEGQNFVALNGGKVPGFDFSPAISLVVSCETQEEIDKLWNNLSADPAAEQCGWLKDKFGITWQIVPRQLNELLNDTNQAKVNNVTREFMKMKKFDIAKLQEAYDKG